MTEKHEITTNIENPEPTINRATKDDIPGIINVQKSRSLAKMIKDGVEKDSIERTGFLVHLLTEPELEELIEKTDEVRVLVYKDGKEVVGYALGYLMRQWKAIHPEWISTIKLKEGEKLEEITDESTIYFRHVATLPTARPGTGAGLSRELVKESQSEGFKNIVAEILKNPFLNKPSFLIHTRMGFEEVGEVDETYEGEKYKWGLFLKLLN
jgi:hypothetical protein